MTINKSVPLTYWNAQTRAVVVECDQLFPSSGFSWGTYNGHDPTRARAADAMVDGYKGAAGIARGTELAEWLWENRIRYNIWYVIWRARIISMTRPASGWITYTPTAAAIRASRDSAYHYNHVHVSTYPETSTPYATVWMDRLRAGVSDSATVRLIQKALGLPQTGEVDAAFSAAVMAFQGQELGDKPAYVDGVLGKFQTAELLTRRKVWATLRTDDSGGDAPAPVDPAEPGQPEPEEPPTPVVLYPMPTSGEVYLDRLAAGVTDSDSVAYAQTWLAKVLGIELPRTGDVDAATIAATKRYQREVLGDADQYVDGLLGKLQTIALAKAAGASVTVYADSKTGGQVWPEVSKPTTPSTPKPTTPSKPQEPDVADALVTVVDANILRQTDPDKTRPRWPARRANVVKAIKSGTPDVVLLQEVDSETAAYIFSALGSGWAYDRCHGVAIGWRQAALERVGDALCYLYPDKENRYHHSVQLRHKASGITFWADCTHLENDGDTTTDGHVARRTEIRSFASRTKSGRRVFGADLNSTTPSKLPAKPTQRQTEKPRPILRAAGWWMLSDQADVVNRALASHHGGELKGGAPKGPWIDDAGGKGVTYVKGSGKLIRTDSGAYSTPPGDHHYLRFTVKL